MKILCKFLYKSALEKKGRLLLLVLSIAVSVALLIGSLHAIDIMVDVFESQARGSYGDYNVIISSKDQENRNLIDRDQIKYLDDEESIKSIQIPSYLSEDEDVQVNVSGMSIGELKALGTMELLEGDNVESFAGNEILISNQTAEHFGFELGEKVKLTFFNDKEEEYKVVGIFEKAGIFEYDGEFNVSAVLPENAVFDIYDIEDQYSNILVKVDSDEANDWVEAFNKENEELKYTAKKTYDEDAIVHQLSWIQGPLYFMLIIVLIMAIFIIYSSFKLIINERLSTIGTFLSQGSTYKQIIALLLGESTIYGVLGGALGVLLGILAISLIKYYAGITDTIFYVQDLNSAYLIGGFIFAIFFSVFSALIPVLSIRKLNTKDIILNKVSIKYKASNKVFIVGALLIGISLIIDYLEPSINYMAAMPNIFIGIIGIILCIPKLVDFISRPVKALFKKFSVIPVLAINNVVNSKVIINNIVLLSISVMAMLIISSIGNSIVDVINDSYELMDFDYTIVNTSINGEALKERVDEIEKDKNIQYTGMIETYLDGDISTPVNLYYVDPDKHKDFEEYMTYSDKEKQLDELGASEEGVIIAKRIADNNNIAAGDTIEVVYDDKTYSLNVLSIVDPRMNSGGNYNIISLNTAKEVFDIKYPERYNLKTELTKEDIQEEVKGYGAEVQSKEEVVASEQENMQQFVDILFLFSIMTMVVGSFGIVSNVSIAYLQRKKDLAVMTSVGLNSFKKKFLIILEAVYQALLGSVIGMISGLLSITLMRSIFIFLTLDLEAKFPVSLIPIVIVVSMVLMLLASVSSVNKSNKLDIVAELKEE